MSNAPTTSNAPLVQDGFEEIECAIEFPDAVDWEKTDRIAGTVKAVHPVKIKDGNTTKDTRLLVLITPDGERGVWESAGLRDLFNSVISGQDLIIEQAGSRKIPGKPSPMRLFKAYRRNPARS